MGSTGNGNVFQEYMNELATNEHIEFVQQNISLGK